MKPIVIFGVGKIADVIQYFMRKEDNLKVSAFTVHSKYMSESSFNGLPVVAYEEVFEKFPPQEYDMFVAVGYQDMNHLRRHIMDELKSKGYQLISFVHPNSGTPKDLLLGENCFVMNNVNIHPRVKLGKGIFVWSGAMIGHHSDIGDYTWVTSSANIGGNVTIGSNCFLAMNSNISHGLSIGNEVFMGSNVLVTQDLKNAATVIAENHKPIKFTSKQFLKFSKFKSL